MRCLETLAASQSLRIALVALAVALLFTTSLALIAIIDARRLRRKITGFDAMAGVQNEPLTFRRAAFGDNFERGRAVYSDAAPAHGRR